MNKQIGQAQTSTLLQDALDVLRQQAELYALGTPLMEELTRLESTGMETNPIQTTSDLMRTLTPIFSHFTRAGVEPQIIAQMQAAALNSVSKDIVWVITPYGRRGFKIQAQLAP